MPPTLTTTTSSKGRRYPVKPPLTEINEFLMCQLCIGYLVDATAITECQHTFCKSCILNYLETNSYCPICEVQLNEAKPHLSLRSDTILQTLVYKLVPGLPQSELRRRREFNTKFDPGSEVMELDEVKDYCFLTPDESVSLSLEYWRKTTTEKGKGEEVAEAEANEKTDRRYLQCPAAVTIGLLKKFIRMKYGLSDDYRVDLLYNGESPMENDLTLLDLSFIYKWKKASPMPLHYRIFDRPAQKPLPIPAAPLKMDSPPSPPDDDPPPSNPPNHSSQPHPTDSHPTTSTTCSSSPKHHHKHRHHKRHRGGKKHRYKYNAHPNPTQEINVKVQRKADILKSASAAPQPTPPPNIPLKNISIIKLPAPPPATSSAAGTTTATPAAPVQIPKSVTLTPVTAQKQEESKVTPKTFTHPITHKSLHQITVTEVPPPPKDQWRPKRGEAFSGPGSMEITKIYVDPAKSKSINITTVKKEGRRPEEANTSSTASAAGKTILNLPKIPGISIVPKGNPMGKVCSNKGNQHSVNPQPNKATANQHQQRKRPYSEFPQGKSPPHKKPMSSDSPLDLSGKSTRSTPSPRELTDNSCSPRSTDSGHAQNSAKSQNTQTMKSGVMRGGGGGKIEPSFSGLKILGDISAQQRKLSDSAAAAVGSAGNLNHLMAAAAGMNPILQQAMHYQQQQHAQQIQHAQHMHMNLMSPPGKEVVGGSAAGFFQTYPPIRHAQPIKIRGPNPPMHPYLQPRGALRIPTVVKSAKPAAVYTNQHSAHVQQHAPPSKSPVKLSMPVKGQQQPPKSSQQQRAVEKQREHGRQHQLGSVHQHQQMSPATQQHLAQEHAKATQQHLAQEHAKAAQQHLAQEHAKAAQQHLAQEHAKATQQHLAQEHAKATQARTTHQLNLIAQQQQLLPKITQQLQQQAKQQQELAQLQQQAKTLPQQHKQQEIQQPKTVPQQQQQQPKLPQQHQLQPIVLLPKTNQPGLPQHPKPTQQPEQHQQPKTTQQKQQPSPIHQQQMPKLASPNHHQQQQKQPSPTQQQQQKQQPSPTTQQQQQKQQPSPTTQQQQQKQQPSPTEQKQQQPSPTPKPPHPNGTQIPSKFQISNFLPSTKSTNENATITSSSSLVKYFHQQPILIPPNHAASLKFSIDSIHGVTSTPTSRSLGPLGDALGLYPNQAVRCIPNLSQIFGVNKKAAAPSSQLEIPIPSTKVEGPKKSPEVKESPKYEQKPEITAGINKIDSKESQPITENVGKPVVSVETAGIKNNIKESQPIIGKPALVSMETAGIKKNLKELQPIPRNAENVGKPIIEISLEDEIKRSMESLLDKLTRSEVKPMNSLLTPQQQPLVVNTTTSSSLLNCKPSPTVVSLSPGNLKKMENLEKVTAGLLASAANSINNNNVEVGVAVE